MELLYPGSLKWQDETNLIEAFLQIILCVLCDLCGNLSTCVDTELERVGRSPPCRSMFYLISLCSQCLRGDIIPFLFVIYASG
jgi:hypothetical protein